MREWKAPTHVFQYDEGYSEQVSEISNKSFVFDEKIMFQERQDVTFLTFNPETEQVQQLVIRIQGIKIYD